ncbi:hypothetical protein ASNO1_02920 [Corallococcus caeni]|uniref:Uncharacterized protein n=1 Tax=Corallococcus caeni TaxID=3082388 RepID=A0ABQ6QJ21_9BACT|nr:hypothetical protein ASNO1_02920 [Corallococcus sp. NO1]
MLVVESADAGAESSSSAPRRDFIDRVFMGNLFIRGPRDGRAVRGERRATRWRVPRAPDTAPVRFR